MTTSKSSFLALVGLAAFLFTCSVDAADTAKPSPGGAKVYEDTVNRAVEYFRTKGQAADGSYSAEASPAITALVTTSILRAGRTADEPLVAKSLKYLQGLVHDDGGIYAEKSTHQNYETCVSIQCFVAANRDGRYDALLKKAEAYVKDLQWDAKEGHDKSGVNYGGAGYGNSKRPDLSNTSFLLDALKAAGRGPDDEAVQKALVFVSRCQNLETEFNTTEFAAKNPDGGFYYTPAAGGSSQAGKTPEGGLRSYGSMTYAGLKSMIYAGLGPDDPRVKAATKWLAQHYTLDENPGMSNAGLFYYYQTFAKALAATGIDQFEDASGKKHDWRADLISQLAKRQKPDGSWVNENNRWLEGDANLVTAYALLALTACREKLNRGKTSPRASERRVLTAEFFARPALTVARELIGKCLVRRLRDREIAAVIHETEAYIGPHDLASHASKGRTARTEVMFGPAGFWYVYFVYGIHWMLNAVTDGPGAASAVLIRGAGSWNGPAKLTKALAIDKSANTTAIAPESGLWVEDRGIRLPPRRIQRTPRIGVDYAGDWAQKPYRFVLSPLPGSDEHAQWIADD